MNTLAAVDNRGAKVSGQILVNGKAQMRGYRNVVAYVQQADTLYETLSVRECIEYSAMLRLSRRLSKREKLEQVEKTIQELHLEKVSNSRIESISGGERRRVSIGMELVNEAKLLICDEPTSGLDSSAANSIMTILSELASRGRIIILSIHQPSVKSFLMMDQIMLLAEGRIMYNGRSSEAAQYFEGKGFSCPVNESISDYMLDVISDRANHDILAGLEIHQYDYDKILETIEGAEDATESSFTEVNGCEPVEPRSITNEFAILFARAFKDILRNRTLFIMQLTLSVALALFAGGIFKGVPNNLAGFQNRMGVSTALLLACSYCLVYESLIFTDPSAYSIGILFCPFFLRFCLFQFYGYVRTRARHLHSRSWVEVLSSLSVFPRQGHLGRYDVACHSRDSIFILVLLVDVIERCLRELPYFLGDLGAIQYMRWRDLNLRKHRNTHCWTGKSTCSSVVSGDAAFWWILGQCTNNVSWFFLAEVRVYFLLLI